MSMSTVEMIKSVFYYIAVVRGRYPSRKADIIKHAMNGQGKDFKDIIRKVTKYLRRVFGLRLVSLKQGPSASEHPVLCSDLAQANVFVLTNYIRQRLILSFTTDNRSFREDVAKGALITILTCCYMNNSALDEDTIWDMLSNLGIAEILCARKEDLRRFLKTEFVDTLYLRKTEDKRPEQIIVTYGWGVRAEVEVIKYELLKFVARIMGRQPGDFINHIRDIPQEQMKKYDEEDKLLAKGNSGEQEAGTSQQASNRPSRNN